MVQKTDLSGGVDHIELSPDECTIYYTSEGAAIHTYNKCTATQGLDFNQVPFTQPVSSTTNSAFGLRILAGGDVLVADSGDVLELDGSGNVIQTYPCSSMPGCGNSLFAMSIDPSGTSFWTADSASGNIYQVNIATGAVMQTISTGGLGSVYGLSVDNQLEVAAPETPQASQPTLTVIPPTTPLVSGIAHAGLRGADQFDGSAPHRGAGHLDPFSGRGLVPGGGQQPGHCQLLHHARWNCRQLHPDGVVR